jgi:phosphoribosylformylglycinamidine synthase
MVHRIEIRPREGLGDPQGQGVLHQVRELGIASAKGVRAVRLFFLYGKLSRKDAARAAEELLIDPIVETYALGSTGVSPVQSSGRAKQGAKPAPTSVIEVHLKPGVMDPVAASTEKALQDMGLAVASVRTARRYEIEGRLSKPQSQAIARKLLANAVIEDVYFDAFTPPEVHVGKYKLKVTLVPIRDFDDKGLEKLSKQGDLFLNLTEMKAIQDHFRSLGREPRDIELEMIAQTWSEHCVHKTFRSDVQLTDGRGKVLEEIPNLIKSTVFAATEKLNKPWCISVFKDNAGVIEFDQHNAVCFKVETHNHPSAIEPYGGASTGIGGVIRDPMGTGMGARPVANTDIFCFGPSDLPASEVPKGVAHPMRIMRGVVAGVRDYGNRMGIPTVNGAVYFDERYVGNPLVFCGTVGILPRDKCFKETLPGDAILVVGGRTGRDGIHGATFSSGELTHAHETKFSHAVQIGNAITEKKTLDTIMQARDLGLYTAITDCGAGGLSSAVGEMGETLGAEVHLDRVPLKYAGLSYPEIWISEAQERMVMSVPQANVERILKVFTDEGVEAVIIGHFGSGVGVSPARGEGILPSIASSSVASSSSSSSSSSSHPTLRLFYQDTLVGELDMRFLHEGLPRPTKQAVWSVKPKASAKARAKKDYTQSLLKILAAPNVASKEWIIRQYDHEVQGGSAIKPLVGVTGDGPGDAAVVRPLLGSQRGVVLSCGMNPLLGDLDPYQSALHAVDEALRNCIAVGGNLDRTAILDNFCWGNCNKPDRMGQLVRSAQGCYDAALAYGTPFISGKDSLNNEFRTNSGETISIPSTLLISAISVINDVSRCVSADAKEPGNVLFLVGRTGSQMGGSHYLLVEGLTSGNDVPPVDLVENPRTMRALQAAISGGRVRACHDLSEGGLAVAAAEMAFSGGVGVNIDLSAAGSSAASVGAVATGTSGGVPAPGPAQSVGLASSPSAASSQGSGPAQSSAAISDAAMLFNESAGRFLVEVTPANRDGFVRALAGSPVVEIGKVTADARVIIATAGRKLIDVPTADAKAAWQGTFKET